MKKLIIALILIALCFLAVSAYAATPMKYNLLVGVQAGKADNLVLFSIPAKIIAKPALSSVPVRVVTYGGGVTCMAKTNANGIASLSGIIYGDKIQISRGTIKPFTDYYEFTFKRAYGALVTLAPKSVKQL